jgi:hypothetical protein
VQSGAQLHRIGCRPRKQLATGELNVRIEELKKMKDRRPFESFFIRMADGREIPVKHPDAVSWDPDQVRIAVCGVPGAGTEVIDVDLVTSLSLPGPAQIPNQGGNGAGAGG